jgi:hypothetical protein
MSSTQPPPYLCISKTAVAVLYLLLGMIKPILSPLAHLYSVAVLYLLLGMIDNS